MEARIRKVGSATAVLIVATGLRSSLPSVSGLKVPDYRSRQGGASCWAHKWCMGNLPLVITHVLAPVQLLVRHSMAVSVQGSI